MAQEESGLDELMRLSHQFTKQKAENEAKERQRLEQGKKVQGVLQGLQELNINLALQQLNLRGRRGVQAACASGFPAPCRGSASSRIWSSTPRRWATGFRSARLSGVARSSGRPAPASSPRAIGPTASVRRPLWPCWRKCGVCAFTKSYGNGAASFRPACGRSPPVTPAVASP